MRLLAATMMPAILAPVFIGQAGPEKVHMLQSFDLFLTDAAKLAGALAFFSLVWAGFLFMVEGSEEQSRGRARRAVAVALGGLVLVLSAKGISVALLSGVIPIP